MLIEGGMKEICFFFQLIRWYMIKNVDILVAQKIWLALWGLLLVVYSS